MTFLWYNNWNCPIPLTIAAYTRTPLEGLRSSVMMSWFRNAFLLLESVLPQWIVAVIQLLAHWFKGYKWLLTTKFVWYIFICVNAYSKWLYQNTVYRKVIFLVNGVNVTISNEISLQCGHKSLMASQITAICLVYILFIQGLGLYY